MNLTNVKRAPQMIKAASTQLPGAQTMSTPTAPGIAPSPAVKSNAAGRGTHNPENALPTTAFHKR